MAQLVSQIVKLKSKVRHEVVLSVVGWHFIRLPYDETLEPVCFQCKFTVPSTFHNYVLRLPVQVNFTSTPINVFFLSEPPSSEKFHKKFQATVPFAL